MKIPIHSDFDILFEALELIASQADNHKASIAYNVGENIALVNIRNIAQIALQQAAEKSRADGSFVRLKLENYQLEETVSQLAEALRLYGNRMPLSRARGDLQFNIDRGAFPPNLTINSLTAFHNSFAMKTV